LAGDSPGRICEILCGAVYELCNALITTVKGSVVFVQMEILRDVSARVMVRINAFGTTRYCHLANESLHEPEVFQITRE
jgi:hypothetical protein